MTFNIITSYIFLKISLKFIKPFRRNEDLLLKFYLILPIYLFFDIISYISTGLVLLETCRDEVNAYVVTNFFLFSNHLTKTILGRVIVILRNTVNKTKTVTQNENPREINFIGVLLTMGFSKMLEMRDY